MYQLPTSLSLCFILISCTIKTEGKSAKKKNWCASPAPPSYVYKKRLLSLWKDRRGIFLLSGSSFFFFSSLFFLGLAIVSPGPHGTTRFSPESILFDLATAVSYIVFLIKQTSAAIYSLLLKGFTDLKNKYNLEGKILESDSYYSSWISRPLASSGRLRLTQSQHQHYYCCSFISTAV